VVLLFFTGPLSLLPGVALSAIVFLIGIRLIDLPGMRDLYRLQRNEFVIASLTVITVALVGVMQGIVLAVVLSLIDQVRHTYRPRTRLWCPDPTGRGFQTVPVAPGVFAAPGILAYRFEANLFYANADRFLEEILDLITRDASTIRALVVDATGIDDVDYSAAKTLLQLRHELSRRGILLTFVVSSSHLLKILARFGIGMDAPVHHSVKKAIRSLAQQLSG
jgi:MFS superfamily sulfate permease-like transporter